MTNFRRAVSIVLAAATLGVVLTYVLGAQAILHSPYAEPGHELFMSIYVPLIQGVTGDHESMSQINGSPSQEGRQMQGMNQGMIGNNMLGGPDGMAAAGLAAVVIMGAVIFAVVAFASLWNQKSYVTAGLLAASGIILLIPPLVNMNFVIPGPIIGVAAGLGILGLGLTNSIRIARTAIVATR